MFDVPAQVLVEFGLQLAQLLLGSPHVLLQLQARLPRVVVAARQRTSAAHLVTCVPHTHKLGVGVGQVSQNISPHYN